MNKTINFRDANTLDDLAIMLDVPVGLLENKINNDNPKRISHPQNSIFLNEEIKKLFNQSGNAKYLEEMNICCNVFCKFELRKKNKNRRTKSRIVWKICDNNYEEFYKKLNYHLTNFVSGNSEFGYPHPAAYGYIRGKNILENAQQHCKAPLILHADICKFFPSITANRIAEMFNTLGITKDVSYYLSKILTIENALPLGLHTSPLISNLICRQLDTDFTTLASKYHCNYTRYADDMTISGEQLPSREEVDNILNENKFELAVDKFRITKPGWHHFVTGLSVETDTPRIPKRMKRRLRQELYYCNKYGVKSHIDKITLNKSNCGVFQKNINRIDGTVKYISYFEKKFNSDIEDLWFEIREKEENVKPKYKNQDKLKKHTAIYIDETEIDYNGKKYLTIGIVSILDNDKNRLQNTLQKLLNHYRIAPFTAINKEALAKNGLHYSDASEDLRKNFLDKISKEYIKIYVGYKKLPSNDSYEHIYMTILQNLINDRLLNTQDELRRIVIEKNQAKVSTEKIKAMFCKAEHCPVSPIFEDKTCILLSLADFALGYFRNYVLATNNEERKRLFFERIRSKYKVIKNLDDEKVFSRRRPFAGDL